MKHVGERTCQRKLLPKVLLLVNCLEAEELLLKDFVLGTAILPITYWQAVMQALLLTHGSVAYRQMYDLLASSLGLIKKLYLRFNLKELMGYHGFLSSKYAEIVYVHTTV